MKYLIKMNQIIRQAVLTMIRPVEIVKVWCVPFPAILFLAGVSFWVARQKLILPAWELLLLSSFEYVQSDRCW